MGLTFLAVHAHPDDEATSTGGLYALLGSQDVRTVLVTCTNGECGDALDGSKPNADHHDGDEVARVRKIELDNSVEVLGIDRLIRLGYRDSGMMGWPQNEDPTSFWATPVDDAAQRLAEILMEERPEVIVTYNEFGFYGHPDHIQANRITLAALKLIDFEPTLYYNAIPNSVMAIMRARWEEEARLEREEQLAKGITPEPDEREQELDLGTPDDEIGATVDVSSVIDAKYNSLAAHRSQLDGSFWLKMPREDFTRAMGTEWFLRVTNPNNLEGNVNDVFAGYR